MHCARQVAGQKIQGLFLCLKTAASLSSSDEETVQRTRILRPTIHRHLTHVILQFRLQQSVEINPERSVQSFRKNHETEWILFGVFYTPPHHFAKSFLYLL